jgi:hypothetical protein
MALIVEFTVPVSKFALKTLTAVPDTTLELGSVIGTSDEGITVYVWARAPDFDALEAAFDDDHLSHRSLSHLKPLMNAPTV